MPPSKKAARGTARAPRSTTNQTGLLQGEEQALPAEEMTLFDYGAWNYEVRASLFLLRAAPGAEQPLFHVTASYDGCWGSRLTSTACRIQRGRDPSIRKKTCHVGGIIDLGVDRSADARTPG